MNANRFLCASSGLSLRELLKHGRKALFVGLGLATVAHLSLTQIRGLREEDKTVKPLTTKFVKRQPRLTKPLEMKKKPRPKRRPLQRKMVSVKAKVSRQQVASSIQSLQVLGNLARPRIQMKRSVGFATEVLEPQAVAQMIEGTKESQYTLDMSLEMVDIDALDTGQYQAMVIQDPNDKRNIKGYLHLAIAYPFSVHVGNFPETGDLVMNGLSRLVTKLNEWTGIKASIAERVTFDSAEFFQTPWTYLWINYSMEPTQKEVENLGKYLLNGGFFFFEGHHWQQWQGERSLMRFVKSALESQGYRQGVDWEYRFLPDAHPIFHCYYDFPGGTPAAFTVVARYIFAAGREDGVDPWSRGIEIDGHLVVLNTNQGYCVSWSEWGHYGGIYGESVHSKYNPTLQFRFGINTIIFALTQEGSITRRVMDTVK